MRILALLRVHNGERTLRTALDSLAGWCDDIYVIDDRSTDNTDPILRRHPAVTNIVRARSDLPPTPWLIPESAGLELLYRMADFCRSDWILMIDSDQFVQADVDIREVLSRTPPDVAALMCPMIPSWDDPDFPDMIPIMGSAESVRGPFWRWYPGLRAGSKALHNTHWPVNITDHGRIELVNEIRLVHTGWASLAERIAKVEHYRRLDPNCQLNFGVPYDRALLFGYALDEIDLLKADYWRRKRGDFDPAEPGARLPIDRERLAFGSAYGPKAGGFHPGVDFAAERGTPIYAVASGIVGRAVDLDLNSGFLSVTISNANVDTVYVFRSDGDRPIAIDDHITAGARIGTLGGEAESPDGYLHFEVRVEGRHTSPVRYLANMGLRPWPPQGRPRPVLGSYAPVTPCTISA
ncbi:peptidoglycan DD-metalloendopeptidase family protein [Mycobacterium szulgai]|uniref:M23ase beta-sheet core domain-containing protein n=1 Tax=Mycobacterium szulgai TaxID=1787 RepID=A0A1X2DNR0_MYCSZ|nr:peptidoglycan DD-metalloendopeptidase family protein [Mycobacterium szulgai]MCV7079014.1 peptidoglycan DD-metalloendopeptidase family protein [Mycobacterium szulgai]ORW89782.1 hypothetical protein AWC27_12975 [Mycobacterium szulgai]